MENYVEGFLKQARAKSDKLMDYFLALYFITGLLLAIYYDTWLIATGVGGLCLLAYYAAKIMLPDSDIYQYVLGGVVGIFMAQFIYQMHGMFEMHFFAFIGSAILITYRNWKLQIPLAVVVLLHHSLFAYLQYAGLGNVYFTQLDYMGIQTFIIHISLSAIIFTLCGFWANSFKKAARSYIIQSYKIGKLQQSNNQKELLVQLSENLQTKNVQLKEAHAELARIFNTIEEVLFSVDMITERVIQVSVACKKIYGYTPEDFAADNSLWSKLIHPHDRDAIVSNNNRLKMGQTVINQYRVIHKNNSVRWVESKIIPTLDAEGVLVRIDGTCHDITERVKLENKLAVERKYQQQQLTAAAITAQENERSFLGQELHDNINPILATAKLYLDCSISEEEKRVALVKESKGFITMAMQEIRKLSKSLVPPSLGDITLRDAIADLTVHIKTVNQLIFVNNWEDFDETVLTDALKLSIYRILQEQLNNVIKHAAATTVWISLASRDGKVEFSIKDDGGGFDKNQKRSGVGLQNIGSRTELFNGKMRIDSEPGKGCLLTIEFNLECKLTPIQSEARA
jgi:PAS domain S-box-containing protein